MVFMFLFFFLLILPINLPSLLANPHTPYVSITTLLVARIGLDMLPSELLLIPNHPNEPLEVYFATAAVASLMLNSPIIFHYLVKFIGPVRDGERRMEVVNPFAALFSALFIFGVIFGYFVLARAFVEDVYKPLFPITGAGGSYADLSDF